MPQENVQPAVGVRLPAEHRGDRGPRRRPGVLVVALSGRDKTTGREIHSRFYDVATIRDGMIARLEEHTSREEALAAAS